MFHNLKYYKEAQTLVSGACLETFMECFENGRIKRSISVIAGAVVHKYESEIDKSSMPKLWHRQYSINSNKKVFFDAWNKSS